MRKSQDFGKFNEEVDELAKTMEFEGRFDPVKLPDNSQESESGEINRQKSQS